MIPMFIYYSMFGFQRIGDLIWAALDSRAKGFLLGGTAGRTTLAGEGLQHQDGNSHLFAIAYPNVRSYDPAFVYESTVIILDGMQRMYEKVRRRDLLHHDRQRKLQDAADARRGRGRNRPRHLQAVERRGRRSSPARAALRQRGDPARSAAGAGHLGGEIRRVERRLERHQLQGTAPRRPCLPALEHAPSDRAAATIVLRQERSTE